MAVIKRQSPSGYVIFCDDIRQETNGKMIFIGVYPGNDMTVLSDSWPVTISKLSLAISYHENRDTFLSVSEIRIYLPGEPEDTPSFRIQPPPKEALQAITPPRAFDDDADLMKGFVTYTIFSPLVIQQEGGIRVIAYIGDDTFKLGSLYIRRQSVSEAINQNPV
jgi:hypothetical protein